MAAAVYLAFLLTFSTAVLADDILVIVKTCNWQAHYIIKDIKAYVSFEFWYYKQPSTYAWTKAIRYHGDFHKDKEDYVYLNYHEPYYDFKQMRVKYFMKGMPVTLDSTWKICGMQVIVPKQDLHFRVSDASDAEIKPNGTARFLLTKVDSKYCYEKSHNARVSYTGNLSVTANGHTCQKWNKPLPVMKNYTWIIPYEHNYCRSPKNASEQPWCFTDSKWEMWGYCKVPECKPSCPNYWNMSGYHCFVIFGTTVHNLGGILMQCRDRYPGKSDLLSLPSKDSLEEFKAFMKMPGMFAKRAGYDAAFVSMFGYNDGKYRWKYRIVEPNNSSRWYRDEPRTPEENFRINGAVFITSDSRLGQLFTASRYSRYPMLCSMPVQNEHGQGIWTNWEPWTKCSASCGKGFRLRVRQCIAHSRDQKGTILCHGNEMDTKECPEDESVVKCACPDGYVEMNKWCYIYRGGKYLTYDAAIWECDSLHFHSVSRLLTLNSPDQIDQFLHKVLPEFIVDFTEDDRTGYYATWLRKGDIGDNKGCSALQMKTLKSKAGAVVNTSCSERRQVFCEMAPKKYHDWESWTEWTNCETTCDGHQYRSRKCKGDVCRHEDEGKKICTYYSPKGYCRTHGCDEGWSFAGEHCYKILKDPVTWKEAFTACTSYGSQLAVVHTLAEKYHYNYNRPSEESKETWLANKLYFVNTTSFNVIAHYGDGEIISLGRWNASKEVYEKVGAPIYSLCLTNKPAESGFKEDWKVGNAQPCHDKFKPLCQKRSKDFVQGHWTQWSQWSPSIASCDGYVKRERRCINDALKDPDIHFKCIGHGIETKIVDAYDKQISPYDDLDYCFGCPKGWHFSGKNCYLELKQTLTKHDARQACARHKATLPVFVHFDEYIMLKQSKLYKNINKHWVGLKSEGVGDDVKLFWDNGFRKRTYYKGEESYVKQHADAHKNCAVFSKGSNWYEFTNCDNAEKVLCSMPKEEVTCGWGEGYFQFGRHCYWETAVPYGVFDLQYARHLCSAVDPDMSLPVLRTPQDILLYAAPQLAGFEKKCVWLGMLRNDSNKFIWEDGSLVPLSGEKQNWHPDYPMSGDQARPAACMRIGNSSAGPGKWFSLTRTSEEKVLCQKFLSNPIDARWSQWSLWSPCSRTCDSGLKQRTRVCVSKPFFGGKDCIGSKSKVKHCDHGQCTGSLYYDMTQYGTRVYSGYYKACGKKGPQLLYEKCADRGGVYRESHTGKIHLGNAFEIYKAIVKSLKKNMYSHIHAAGAGDDKILFEMQCLKMKYNKIRNIHYDCCCNYCTLKTVVQYCTYQD